MSVTFSYSAWLARYPEFSAITEPTAQIYFDEATLYCDNTASSVVAESKRSVLLNMLVAHIAALSVRDAQLVGRVSSASEGSVSVSIEGPPQGTGLWYQQTKYGMAYWQATSNYRRHRMFPARTRIMDPWAANR